MQLPYRTVSKARDIVAEEIERMGKANIIEHAAAVWASPSEIMRKHDG